MMVVITLGECVAYLSFDPEQAG